VAVKIEAVDADKPGLPVIQRAAKLILSGEVVVCPTDTGYAFSANALDADAVAKVFALKGRAFANPIHVAVGSVDEAAKYAYINRAAAHLSRRFLPGALTLVLPRREVIPAVLVGGRETVGIRIPANKVMLNLADMAGLPLTATSANISGQPTPYDAEEVVEQLGQNIENIALVLDQGPLPAQGLSTIVDLTVSPPQLLRQGLIDWDEIKQVLQSV